MIKILYRFVLCFYLIFVCLITTVLSEEIQPHKMSFSSQVVLTAESVVYDKDKNVILAEQNVKIKYKELFLETEYLVYDIKKNIIYASSDTFVSYHGSRLLAKSLEYNINTEELIINNFYAYYQPYYSYSKNCSVRKNDLLLINAKVTHCNKSVPHYYLQARNVVVILNKKIKLYSPTLVINKIPLLWIPYYEVSLQPSQDYLTIEPSYENERGIITKVKYGKILGKNTEIRFLCDNYGVDSIGVGSELRYWGDNHNGIIYLYYIDYLTSPKTRWNFRINNTHKLPYKWEMKNSIELISDNQVFYQYEKDNWFLTKTNLNSFISLSKDVQKLNFRIIYQRNDKYEYEKQKFVNNYYQIPLELTFYPFSFGKIKITERFKFLPTFIEGTTYYNLLTDNNLVISLPLSLTKIMSFLPSIGAQSVYTTSSEKEHIYYNIYSFQLPTKVYISKYCNLEMIYNYKIKSQNNSFSVIINTQNVLTQNLLTRVDLHYKNNFLRVYTTYDFIKPKEYKWYQKFYPITIEGGSSYKKLAFFTNLQFRPVESTIGNFQLSTEYRYSISNSIMFTYSKNYSIPYTHSFIPQLNIYIPDNLQLRVRSAINFIEKEKIVEVINTSAELYKDLHCWECKIFCNIKKSLPGSTLPYVIEFGGNIGLKFKPYVGTGGKVSEIDQKYFPWR